MPGMKLGGFLLIMPGEQLHISQTGTLLFQN
jgi:hypothetical protein